METKGNQRETIESTHPHPKRKSKESQRNLKGYQEELILARSFVFLVVSFGFLLQFKAKTMDSASCWLIPWCKCGAPVTENTLALTREKTSEAFCPLPTEWYPMVSEVHATARGNLIQFVVLPSSSTSCELSMTTVRLGGVFSFV